MILNSNALSLPMKDKSVQCAITSPPYWGLRDYGTAKWIGGDPDCNHKAPPTGGTGQKSALQLSQKRKDFDTGVYRDICGKCGAIREDDQLGLESTPELYVANMVKVFREVWRVLKDDGVLWLNLGDSYASSAACERRSTIGAGSPDKTVRRANRLGEGRKNKDLCGIPWMVAFALRSDGWYLRQDIIWYKRNPMPESVTDRCTKAHEYIFLMTKNARYYYDHEAIMTPSKWASKDKRSKTGPTHGGKTLEGNYSMQSAGAYRKDGMINKRSVWDVTTKPYKGAHFATFPPDLVEPMVLAGSREGDIVFDPFSGTSTVGQVAQKHKRKYVGTELSLDYIRLAQKRLRAVDVVLF